MKNRPVLVSPLDDPKGIYAEGIKNAGFLWDPGFLFEHCIVSYTGKTSKDTLEAIRGNRTGSWELIEEPLTEEREIKTYTGEPKPELRIKLNYIQCLTEGAIMARNLGNVPIFFWPLDRVIYAGFRARSKLFEFRTRLFHDKTLYNAFNSEVVFACMNRDSMDMSTYPEGQAYLEEAIRHLYTEAGNKKVDMDMASGGCLLSVAAAELIVDKTRRSELQRFPEAEWPLVVKAFGGRWLDVGTAPRVNRWEHDIDTNLIKFLEKIGEAGISGRTHERILHPRAADPVLERLLNTLDIKIARNRDEVSHDLGYLISRAEATIPWLALLLTYKERVGAPLTFETKMQKVLGVCKEIKKADNIEQALNLCKGAEGIAKEGTIARVGGEHE